MASVEVSFISPVIQASALDAAYPFASEVITSTASNQTTTATALAGHTAIVVSVGGDVKVQIGQSPNATTGSVRLVPDGQFRAFSGLRAGDRVSVVDL
jgi:hypothetical protein